MQLLPYEQCREIERTHLCAQCGAPLVTVWVGEEDSYGIKCGEDKHHEGFQRVLSPTQMYKAGLKVPIYVKDAIERRLEMSNEGKMENERETLDFLIPIKDAGSGELLRAEAREMIVVTAGRVGLDPYLGHVILYHGKPYVTEAGLLYHAHRSGKLKGIQTRPLETDERQLYQIPEEEHAWIAMVHKEGHTMAFLGIGRAREDPNRPIAKGSFVEHQHPQRMAEKRAEMQALRKAFPLGLPVLGEGEETTCE